MSSWRSRSAGRVSVTTFRRWNRSSRKPAAADFRFELAVGGGDQPDIGLAFPRLAESFVGPVVEKPQKARLGVRRQVADFVEQQRSALGFLDFARHVGNRARERALAMTEKGARHQVARQGRALTVTKGASARGLFARIQRARTFFPVPLSPRKQQHGVGCRCARGRLQGT